MLKYYDVYRNGEFIGKFTAVEASELIGCKQNTVRDAAKKYMTLRKEYKVEDGAPEDFEKKWTEACNQAKRALGLPVESDDQGNYVVFRDGVRIPGTYPPRKIGEMCGILPKNVWTWADRGHVWQGRWRFVRKEDYESLKKR